MGTGALCLDMSSGRGSSRRVGNVPEVAVEQGEADGAGKLHVSLEERDDLRARLGEGGEREREMSEWERERDDGEGERQRVRVGSQQ